MRQLSLLFQQKYTHFYLSCQPVSEAIESHSLVICSSCCSLFLMKYFGVALAAQTNVNKRLLSMPETGEGLHTLKQSEEDACWNTREQKLCWLLLFQSLLLHLLSKLFSYYSQLRICYSLFFSYFLLLLPLLPLHLYVFTLLLLLPLPTRNFPGLSS